MVGAARGDQVAGVIEAGFHREMESLGAEVVVGGKVGGKQAQRGFRPANGGEAMCYPRVRGRGAGLDGRTAVDCRPRCI